MLWKRPSYQKATNRFSATLNKIPVQFFTEIENTILKLGWKHRETQMATAILTNKNSAQAKVQNHSSKNSMVSLWKPDTLING